MPPPARPPRGGGRGLAVIGAGPPRSGTNSMKHALTRLGYHTAHGGLFWFNSTVSNAWLAWMDNGDFAPAVQTLLDQGFNATVDGPMNLAYRELMELFPDAKVVLTVRDSGKQWFESVSRLKAWTQAGQAAQGQDMERPAKITDKVFQPYGCDVFSLSEVTAAHAERCAAGYERFLEEVQSTVPAERLLVYNTRDGWEPLCGFLGLPVPPVPFPHVKTLPPFLPEALTRTWRGVSARACLLLLALGLWGHSWRRRAVGEGGRSRACLHGFFLAHASVLLCAVCRSAAHFLWHIEQLVSVDA